MKNIKYLFYSILIVITFFGCLEIAFRIANIGNPDENFDTTLGFGDSEYFLNDWESPDSMRTSPHYLFEMQDIRFKKSPESDVFRVMMYGESNVNYLNQKLFEKTFNEDKQLTKFGKFEFINLGLCGCGSRRISVLLNQSVIYHPSLIFIYMGNNEFEDMIIKNSVIQHNKQFPWLRSILSNTYTYNWAKKTYRNILKPKLDLSSKEVNDRLFDTPYQVYDTKAAGYAEFREMVYQNFKNNLQHMIRTAKKNNIKVIISTVPSNETIPVYCPFYPENLSKDDLKDIKRLEKSADNKINELLEFLKVKQNPYAPSQLNLYNGIKSYISIFNESLDKCHYYINNSKPLRVTPQLKSKLLQSAELYEQALRISDEVPQIHYKLGVVSYLLKDYLKARYHFRKSSELDAAPLRSSPTINKIIQEVAEEEKISLIDFEQSLCPKGLHGICDWSLIDDHVHLNENSKNQLMNMLKEKFKQIYLKE